MPGAEIIAGRHVTLVDAVDHLLDRGAVLVGDATLSLAGVDLVYVGLNLIVSSVETMHQHGDWGPVTTRRPPLDPLPQAERTDGSSSRLQAVSPLLMRQADAESREHRGTGASSEILHSAASLQQTGVDGSDPSTEDRSERSLARLVLALIELLRQIMERQALRRMEGQGLSEEQIERMGRGLMELAAKMTELRTVFDLREDDLAIDLGPLGKLY